MKNIIKKGRLVIGMIAISAVILTGCVPNTNPPTSLPATIELVSGYYSGVCHGDYSIYTPCYEYRFYINSDGTYVRYAAIGAQQPDPALTQTGTWVLNGNKITFNGVYSNGDRVIKTVNWIKKSETDAATFNYVEKALYLPDGNILYKIIKVN